MTEAEAFRSHLTSAADLNATVKSALQNRDRMEHEPGIMLNIMYGNVVDDSRMFHSRAAFTAEFST